MGAICNEDAQFTREFKNERELHVVSEFEISAQAVKRQSRIFWKAS